MSSYEKTVLNQGNGVDKPEKGDTVTIAYVGHIYDPSKEGNKGDKFDSTEDRGDFKTPIGIGRVIKGWDEGVQSMSLGEKAILVIPSHAGYGERGFPGLIPANATLMFEVHLKGINDKKI